MSTEIKNTTPKEMADSIFTDMHYLICNTNGLSESESTIRSAKQCATLAIRHTIEALKVFHTGPEWLLKETMAWTYWHKVADEALLIPISEED